MVNITGLDEPIKLRTGKHGLVVTGKDIEPVQESFTVRRGENPALRVTLVRQGAAAKAQPQAPVGAKPKESPPANPSERSAGEPRFSSPLEVRTFDAQREVSTVAFSPDGRRAIAASHAKSTILAWDVDSGEIVHRFEGDTDNVTSVALSPDNHLALFGRKANQTINEKSMRLWNFDKGKELRRLQGHTNDVTSVAFSPDGRRALSCAWDTRSC